MKHMHRDVIVYTIAGAMHMYGGEGEDGSHDGTGASCEPEEEEEETEEEEEEEEEDKGEEEEGEEGEHCRKGTRRQGRKCRRKRENGSRGEGRLLYLSRGSYFLCYLEQRKRFELRKRRTQYSGRLLLACSQQARASSGIQYMIEGRLAGCRGPYTAAEIKANPDLRGGVQLSDMEIDGYLGGGNGFLYLIEGVKKSRAELGMWEGNGSNATGLVCRTVLSGEHKRKERWTESER